MGDKPRALVFGEALWDLLPSGPVLGGAPLNFAYRLGSLGIPTRFVSQVGDDARGQETLDQMLALGMDTSLVSVSADLPTATVIVELDEERQPHYTIVENVAYDAVPWTDALEQSACEAGILCFGTLAQRDPRSRETLHRIAAAFRGETVLVDINLRPRCYTPETVRWSLDQATIAKLNDEELAEIAAMYGVPPGESPAAQAQSLRGAAGLESLVVTLGARGALAVTSNAEPVVVPGFVVEVDDPCGSGDAFAGMFVASLVHDVPLRDALLRANALGALVATQPGATQKISRDQIDSIILNGRRVDPRDLEDIT